jgi:hypothetical protein
VRQAPDDIPEGRGDVNSPQAGEESGLLDANIEALSEAGTPSEEEIERTGVVDGGGGASAGDKARGGSERAPDKEQGGGNPPGGGERVMRRRTGPWVQPCFVRASARQLCGSVEWAAALVKARGAQ